MATLGIFGGSFDPPHVGHVLFVRYVLVTALVDRVIVVPVRSHAFDKKLLGYDERLELVRIAFADEPRALVSDVERQLPDPSYTYNSVAALREQYPGDTLRLLVGTDVAAETHRWHRWDELRGLAPPIIIGRAGLLPRSEEAIDLVLPVVSSTELRRVLAEEGPNAPSARSLLPVGVRELVEARGHYRSSDA